jgi:hypothetical protein
LLQNWWISKYFIEVSAEYLASTKAYVNFAVQEIKSIPNTFSCTNAPFVETWCDGADTMNEMH